MVNKMSFIKKAKARIRKRFTELSALNICWGASLIIAALLFKGSYDKEAHAFQFGGVPFILCLLYLIPMMLAFLLSLKVRAEIGKKEEISGAARKLGIALVPFG